MSAKAGGKGGGRDVSNRSSEMTAKKRGAERKLSDKSTRADGRYVKTFDNKELCFAWNRDARGCREPCGSKPPREHVCEWCLSRDHRAIDDVCKAPKRPKGWKPKGA
eukprot:3907289-Karenia_brevis.AAC.1